MPERMSEYLCHILSRWYVRNYIRIVTVRVGITRSKVIVMNIFFITKGIKQMNSRYDHGENPGDKMCFFSYRTCHRDVGRHLRSKSDMDWDIPIYLLLLEHGNEKSSIYRWFSLTKKKQNLISCISGIAQRHAMWITWKGNGFHFF